mgnify:CR=1 FL=1
MTAFQLDLSKAVIFPHSGWSQAAWMKRIGVVSDVAMIAEQIHNWGGGATKFGTLRGAIQYYGNMRFASHEHVLEVEDFFADRVFGGLDADLSKFERDEMREVFFAICQEARATMGVYRRCMQEAVQPWLEAAE